MHAVKLIPIGDSLAVVLPQEVVDRLHLIQGGTVYLSETLEGVRLTSQEPLVEEQLALARQIMKDRQAVLRELAK